MMGVHAVNESVAISRSRDKLRSMQLLARRDIGLPVTGFAHTTEDIPDLINMVGGAPLVVKLLKGTQGVGVVLCETRKAAESVIEAFFGIDEGPFIAIGAVMMAAGIATALALGLGAREIAGNLLAGLYLRDSHPLGTRVAVAGLEGKIKAIDPRSTLIAAGDDEEVSVPNMTMVRATVRLRLPPVEPDEDAIEP